MCIYINSEDFRKYLPLYICASLIYDEGWAFECSFSNNYLTPGIMEENIFFEFIDDFSKPQIKLMYDFVLYNFIEKNDLMVMEALNSFWCLYVRV